MPEELSSADQRACELDLGEGQTVVFRSHSPGDKISRYSLKSVIGRGGMGVVWRALDEELGRDVALKFLPESVVADEQAIKNLKRETLKAQELRHHHIVQVYDFISDKASPCIAMEYIDGPTLSAIKARKENDFLEVHEITRWVEQLCEALAYAHEKARVVHRDLKPANLMINSKGELKVTDFGIARSVSDSMSMLSRVSETSGTLVYMSPQQLDGERATHLDDIYSLGATIYELLTGEPPFCRGNIDKQIREKTPMSMTARRVDRGITNADPIPETWENVVAACLAKDPAQRPQSAGEVIESLGIEARPSRRTRGAATSTSAPEAAVMIGNVLYRRRPITVTLSLLLVGVAFVTWYWGLHRPTVGREQVKREASATATAPVANARGGVLIKTEPPGAIVTVGDESKKSPATFNSIKVGSWRVKVEFDGYEPAEQQVAVEENQISDPGVIELIRSTGTAQVSTSPEGTDFDLVDADGQHHTGKTPAELRDLPVGHGNIVFNREGMASHSQGIKVERNQIASIIWNAPVEGGSLVTPQQSAATSPATNVADTSFTNSLRCTMVWIPGLRIWVAESEITQREFSSLMDHNPSDHVGADLPVDSVTEPEAMEFCDRLSKKDAAAGVLPSGYAYTLPTDEQWTVFCGDASLGDAVTSHDKPRNGPEPVKSLTPNQYGLYDTRGNVWEWTQTKYSPSLNSPEIRAEFPFGVVQSGPRKGKKKGIDPEGLVLRGGSWRSKGDLLKTTTRGSNSPTTRDNTNGFRIVLAPRE